MESSQIIILAIIATSLATFISRFMGALTSEKVSVKSKTISMVQLCSLLNFSSVIR